MCSPEGKRSFVKRRRGRDDNSKMDFLRSGMGKYVLDLSGSGRDKWRDLVNEVMNLRVP